MIERREGRRFQVDWAIKVEQKEGEGFSEEGVLQNISSGGALVSLSKPLPVGTRLDVHIKLPFKKSNWMRYSAFVIRVRKEKSRFAAAVKFEGAKPGFAT
ncbi:MAG: PilZ domain-containing protein [Blastocatellia bacterium]